MNDIAQVRPQGLQAQLGEVAVGEFAALRLAGRAGGVDDGRQVGQGGGGTAGLHGGLVRSALGQPTQLVETVVLDQPAGDQRIQLLLPDGGVHDALVP
jgi:hypothetical protein